MIKTKLIRFAGSADRFVYEDKNFRPTWEPKKNYRLKAEHRHQLCVHLAAHAVVSSMGGAGIYMLAVAPAGVRSWTIGDRKSRSLGKLWGVCSTSDYICDHLAWDDDHQIYIADRDGWESWYKKLDNAEMQSYKDRGSQGPDPTTLGTYLAGFQHVVRSQACGYLAGHIADGITAGMEATEALRLYDRRDSQYVGASDIAIAQGLADLLPDGEYEHVVRLTEAVLRRPEVWAVVQRLASELERLGLIEGGPGEDDALALLPPTEQDWPPALDRAGPPQQA
jgi:hypothetical protein